MTCTPRHRAGVDPAPLEGKCCADCCGGQPCVPWRSALAIFGPTRVRARTVRARCASWGSERRPGGGGECAPIAARTYACHPGRCPEYPPMPKGERAGGAGGPPCAPGAIGPTRLRRCFPSTAARCRGQRVATRHSMLQRGTAHRRAWCRGIQKHAASATRPDRSKRAIAARVYGDREGGQSPKRASAGASGVRRREGARERAGPGWISEPNDAPRLVPSA